VPVEIPQLNPRLRRKLAIGLALLLVLEGLSRAVLPATGPLGAVPDSVRLAHPENLHQVEWVVEETTRRYYVSTDANGLRLPENMGVYLPDDESIFTLAVLGDGKIFGVGMPAAASVPDRVAAQIGSLLPQSRVQAINGGVAGSSTLQSYLLFRDVIGAYGPDLVVLQLSRQDQVARATPDSVRVADFDRRPLDSFGLSRAWSAISQGTAHSTANAAPSLSSILPFSTGPVKWRFTDGSASMPLNTRVPPDDLRRILHELTVLGKRNGFQLAVYFDGSGQPSADLLPWTSIVDEFAQAGRLVHLYPYNGFSGMLQRGVDLEAAATRNRYSMLGSHAVAKALFEAIRRQGLVASTR
jgi:hypothetical protein